ncbi:hypothetical protein F5B22DRAFT_650259 [Xylaria bambusicola]|uniref:uncharacterized protein n=1 Tax=Xylaria bambusicola TaxID=326684 RepID=UPI002008B0B0|nr:uncharacterized protein F5B22DRAFT_650259 [Xylaria bambusicola]KAI0506942.1 hypothetical protein F5B22DRAFT_650259 [Xylaria bambusicola]
MNEETRPTHEPTVPSRRLFKGTLSPPCAQPAHKSYTLAPASISKVHVKDLSKKQASGPDPIAISSTAVRQPFVDPAVLQRGHPPAA